jgi:hypothetical protein
MFGFYVCFIDVFFKKRKKTSSKEIKQFTCEYVQHWSFRIPPIFKRSMKAGKQDKKEKTKAIQNAKGKRNKYGVYK